MCACARVCACVHMRIMSLQVYADKLLNVIDPYRQLVRLVQQRAQLVSRSGTYTRSLYFLDIVSL